MQEYTIDYTNENEFKKLERSLKKYNIPAFKKLNFEYYPALRNGKFVGNLIKSNKKDGILKYELILPSDKMFAAIHGETKLFFTVYQKEKNIMLETITPTEVLLEGHMSELTTYKGIMISKANASKDKFKIDLLNMLQDNKQPYFNKTTISNTNNKPQNSPKPKVSKNEKSKSVTNQRKNETKNINNPNITPAKVESVPEVTPNNKISYPAGEWIVGEDIKPGRYILTGTVSFHIYDSINAYDKGKGKCTLQYCVDSTGKVDSWAPSAIIYLHEGQFIQTTAPFYLEKYPIKTNNTPKIETKKNDVSNNTTQNDYLEEMNYKSFITIIFTILLIIILITILNNV